MIAEEPIIEVSGHTYMCDGTYGGLPKEQVKLTPSNYYFNARIYYGF